MNNYKIYLESESFFGRPYCFYGFEILKNIKPEKLNEVEIKLIENKLKKDKNNLFFLETYIIYHYNKGKLDLDLYFKRYINLNPNNPYMLLRYARFQSSSLYKLYNKDRKYLKLALDNLKKAINILEKMHNESEVPTFIYSWFGYIYIELGDYNKAIELFDKTIYLNNYYHNHLQSEPFLWKAIALNKLGKYKESNILYLENIRLVKKGKINNKLDFRVFREIADNYFNLKNKKNFYSYLRRTIEKFLQDFSFHFNNNLLLNFKNISLNFDNIIEKNKYNSFLEYTKNYIYDDIDNIIFSIAFLYKEKLLGKNIEFNDSRGIELLCYNYLKTIYEGKI